MEHRNSTILTEPARLRSPDEQLGALSTAVHEFFHSWNVERIRPRSLEPVKARCAESRRRVVVCGRVYAVLRAAHHAAVRPDGIDDFAASWPARWIS
jgi:hypothetical protein